MSTATTTSIANRDSTTVETTIGLTVEGMNCASCVGRVERALKTVPGVVDARVNLATERADIDFAGPPDLRAAVAAIDKAGYKVVQDTVELAVDGMSCASCVGRVERALEAVPGVAEASVNLATERAQVRRLRGVSDERLLRAVAAAGYEARVVAGDSAGVDDEAGRREAEAATLKRAALLAVVLTLPVFVLEMGSHFIPGMHDRVAQTIGMQASWTLQFVLTSIVLFGPGLRFFRQGIPALLRGAPDMNSLVAVGTATGPGNGMLLRCEGIAQQAASGEGEVVVALKDVFFRPV